MSSIEIRGTPRAILNGVKDESGRVVPAIVSDITGFNPLIYLLTERGPEGTYDLDSVGGIDTYGIESMRTNSPFYTHQTVLAQSVIPHAPVHVHRVRLPDATRAVIRVSIEVATSEIPYYVRNSQGEIVYTEDENGLSSPAVDYYGLGTRFVLHYGTDMYPLEQRCVGQAEVIHNFREGDVTGFVDNTHRRNFLSYLLRTTIAGPEDHTDGLTTDQMLDAPEDAESLVWFTTTLYPIIDVELADFGGFGNRMGLIIDDLTSILNNNPAMWDLKQFIYQLRLVEQSRTGTKTIINTDGGDRSTAFCLGDNGFSDAANLDYNWSSVLNRSYKTMGRTQVYSSNIAELSNMAINGYSVIDEYNNTHIVPGELSFGDDGLLSNGSINFFGGVNTLRQSYQSLRVQDSFAFGGSRIGGAAPIMGTGGDDGHVFNTDGTVNKLETLRLFDEEVRRQLEGFGDLEDPLLDIARYPISALVDTGFSNETKEAMVAAFNKRPDVFAILTTFRVAEYMEPELPPPPTPRKSIVEAVRPPQAVFDQLPQPPTYFTVSPDALTYTFTKDSATLTTDITVSIKEEALQGEGIIPYAIPLGFSVAYRENAFLRQQLSDVPIGTLTTPEGSTAYTAGRYNGEFQFGLGTAMTSWLYDYYDDPIYLTYGKLLLSSNHLGVAQYKPSTQYVWDMDFDESGQLYIPTTNTFNVNVVTPLTFDIDEFIFSINSTGGLYDLKVSDQTYTGLNIAQVVQTLKNANFEVLMYAPELGG